ncbi:TRAP transporter small permease [Pseudoblastomonas halimionae]|uniref:TRAP transporter small permease protein n=1 Tax=Alteriqipengyuania halimionae TaxID=1926630 RepID=A0A6I4U5V7_9SPHN|nr:TRAP transporter small permease [Alteriqipengyuania halimionae]MXP10285.1 TRAP transporter small permease subunit [Alteriqipengyuania halimionae]
MMARIARGLIVLSSAGLAAMALVIGWQVFGRFVLASSPSWTEQASLVLMIWYVMFAAAAGVYEGFHIRIALLEERLGDRAGPVRRIVAAVIALIGLVLCIYGAQMCWLVRENVIPSIGVSRAVAYIPMPIAGLLMMLFALPQLSMGQAPRDNEEDA